MATPRRWMPALLPKPLRHQGLQHVHRNTNRVAIAGRISSIKSLVPTGLRARIISVITDDDRVAVEFEDNAVTSEGDP